MLKTSLFLKIKKTTKKFKVKTQRTRAELIMDLKILLEIAQNQAHDWTKAGDLEKNSGSGVSLRHTLPEASTSLQPPMTTK
jgi:hypothetical protein